MDEKACSHYIVMGDFNAKIGVRNVHESMTCIVPFGTGNRDERWGRLLDFGAENNLVVTNSFSQKAANRYWAWEAPDGMMKSKIDCLKIGKL